MEMLARAEAAIIRVLGEEHPVRYRARHGIALAHAQLSDYERSAAVLRDLLDRQIATLGRHHPDSLLTRLDLGVALLMSRRHAEARPLIDEAERELHRQFGWSTELAFRAKVTRFLGHVLPAPAWELYKLYDRKVSKPKTD